MRIVALTIACLGILSPDKVAAEDSWTFAPEQSQVETYSLPPSDAILKWCDESGKKIRYSKDPVPGYRLCGEIEAVKLCDPSGKRFIGSAGKDKQAPYTYKDCDLGQRITVTRHDPLANPDTAGLNLPAGPMSDAERLEAHQKIDQIKSNDPGDLARELQGLSMDLSTAVREMRKAMGGKVD